MACVRQVDDSRAINFTPVQRAPLLRNAQNGLEIKVQLAL